MYITCVFCADTDAGNNDQVHVSVTDGSETVTQSLTVSVTDVDEANNEVPTIDSQNGIFTLNGGDSSNIKFTLSNNDT
ncbi:MAG: hypothetical protein AAFV71_29605 [Cyanobacteria bacterium J06633_8]